MFTLNNTFVVIMSIRLIVIDFSHFWVHYKYVSFLRLFDGFSFQEWGSFYKQMYDRLQMISEKNTPHHMTTEKPCSLSGQRGGK